MPRPPPPAEAPITEDDAFLAKVLERASIPTLLMSLVHLTGDAGLLRGPARPGRSGMGDTQGGMSREDKAAVRALALRALADYRDRGCTLPPPPTPETLHEMMSVMVGEAVPRAYVPMMLEELALEGRDVRGGGLGSCAPDLGGPVLVIGAGMSGLLAAIRLEEAGVPYVVVEKNDAVGGTWYENTYPGCRVDVANHFYCYSFEPNHDWPEYYSGRDELFAYFERCATRYGVRPRIRFRTTVEALHWDEGGAGRRPGWEVRLRTPEGEETLRAPVVVSAVGQLNRPKLPDIEGRERFAGPAFHSARWEHEHALAGRRIGVVGTGASALQIVPELARVAGHLSVFQRSPCWVSPNPRYHRPVHDDTKWLLKHVPYYARWYRFLLFWPASDGLFPSLVIDPDWPHPDRSVNATNERVREAFVANLRAHLGGDEALLAKLTPTYPPFGKRMLQDDGSWLRALARENVSLVTEAIERITPAGIVTRDGKEHPLDVLVFATGFHANRFLWPMEVVGRDGLDLRAHWGEDPQAYLGITVPGFPNLFCLYGPGTNLAHAGSIIFHAECQVRYVMGCLAALAARDAQVLECRADVCEAFNERLQERMRTMVWSHPGMDSWYKNRFGRVTTTSPWRLVEYWDWTRTPDPADFVLR